MNKFTIHEFRAAFAGKDACLDKIFQLRFNNLICPKCENDKPFQRVKDRRSSASVGTPSNHPQASRSCRERRRLVFNQRRKDFIVTEQIAFDDTLFTKLTVGV